MSKPSVEYTPLSAIRGAKLRDSLSALCHHKLELAARRRDLIRDIEKEEELIGNKIKALVLAHNLPHIDGGEWKIQRQERKSIKMEKLLEQGVKLEVIMNATVKTEMVKVIAGREEESTDA